MTVEIPGFERRAITLAGADGVHKTRDVYVAGEGPAVIVMTEVPGITPHMITFAERLLRQGLSVYMPQLFGKPGAALGVGTTTSALLEVCIRREFSLLSSGASSPIVAWLRGLARLAHEERGGPGVGAIGMCVTGNFALGMMIDTKVIAPVLSQPSLPLGLTRAQRRGLHVSQDELAAVKAKVANEGAKVLGLRFHGDPLCPAARFERLREELGDGFEGIELDPRSANRAVPTTPHSVLTVHLIDREGEPTREALDRTLAFLKERLLPTS